MKITFLTLYMKGFSARKEAQIWVWLSPTVKLFKRLISFVALLLQCSNLEWKMSSPFFFIKSRMFIEICRRENVIIFSDKKKKLRRDSSPLITLHNQLHLWLPLEFLIFLDIESIGWWYESHLWWRNYLELVLVYKSLEVDYCNFIYLCYV